MKAGDVSRKSLPLAYPSWQLHNIKVWVIRQIVLQYAHAQWVVYSVTSPGLAIIDLSSLTSQLKEVQAECYHMQWLLKTHWHAIFQGWKCIECAISILSLASIYADLGICGHPAVWRLLHMPLSTIAIHYSSLSSHIWLTLTSWSLHPRRPSPCTVFANFSISSSVFSF